MVARYHWPCTASVWMSLQMPAEIVRFGEIWISLERSGVMFRIDSTQTIH